MPGYELIGEEEKQAVIDVFERGGVLYRYGLDAKRRNVFRVDEFEKKLAERVGARYALCVCNGTAALKLALFALGIKEGDEVITQSFTFVATVEAILELGAIPVITEIDASLTMEPLDLEQKITNKTKAIIPVHMAGVAARMDAILNLAQKRGLPVVEDSCQALGGTYRGKCLGTFGNAGVYSLDIGKIITTGEGGILVTDDRQIYLKAREYSDHGHELNASVPRGEDTRTTWGFNYKASEIHGAIGLAQLAKLNYILQKQKVNKMRIKAGLQNISNIKFREIPDPEGDASDTLIFFVKSREKASRIAKYLAETGVNTKNLPDAINWHFAGMWTHIFSQYPNYRNKNLEDMWPQSADFLRRAIALPIAVNINDEQILHVITSVRDAIECS